MQIIHKKKLAYGSLFQIKIFSIIVLIQKSDINAKIIQVNVEKTSNCEKYQNK